MNIEALQPATLKKVIALLEKREQLKKLIEEMNKEIADLITDEEASRKAGLGKKKSVGPAKKSSAKAESSPTAPGAAKAPRARRTPGKSASKKAPGK